MPKIYKEWVRDVAIVQSALGMAYRVKKIMRDTGCEVRGTGCEDRVARCVLREAKYLCRIGGQC